MGGDALTVRLKDSHRVGDSKIRGYEGTRCQQMMEGGRVKDGSAGGRLMKI